MERVADPQPPDPAPPASPHLPRPAPRPPRRRRPPRSTGRSPPRSTTRSARPASAAATSASVAATAVIAPPAGSACISRARAATSAHASCSDSTPAAYAAVTSPTEWPGHRVGVDPARAPAAPPARRRPRTARPARTPSDPPAHRRGPAQHHLRDRDAELGLEQAARLIEGRREHRAGGVQVRTHPGPLAALTGEQEPHPAAPPAGTTPVTTPGAGCPRRHRRQAMPGARTCPARSPPPGARTPPASSPATTPHPAAPGPARGHELPQPPACAASPASVRPDTSHGTGRRREHRAGTSTGPASARSAGGGGRGAERPAALLPRSTCAFVPLNPNEETAGPPRAARPWPGHLLGQQPHRPRRPVHVGGGPIHMQGGREHAVPQGQHHLDHPGHSRRGLGVTDVRLHRTEPQRPVLGPVLPVGRDNRLRLDRVAEDGPGPVGLDHVHVAWRQPRRWPAPPG